MVDRDDSLSRISLQTFFDISRGTKAVPVRANDELRVLYMGFAQEGKTLIALDPVRGVRVRRDDQGKTWQDDRERALNHLYQKLMQNKPVGPERTNDTAKLFEEKQAMNAVSWVPRPTPIAAACRKASL